MYASAPKPATAPASASESVRAQVTAALDKVKGRLRGHGGDVVVEKVDDGVVSLDFQGACRGCPALSFTYLAVVEPTVREVPGVRDIEIARSAISPAVIRRIEKMMG